MKKSVISFAYLCLMIKSLLIIYELLHKTYYEIVNSDNPILNYCNTRLNDILYYATLELHIYSTIIYVLFLENNTIIERLNEQDDLLNVEESDNSFWDHLNIFLVKYKIIIVVYLFIIAYNLESISLELLLLPVKIYVIGYLLIFSGKLIIILLPLLIFYMLLIVILGSKEKQLIYHKIDVSVIPKEIRNYISNLGIELSVFKMISGNPNIFIKDRIDNISIFLQGDIIEFLTKKEFISCLYHEIGHFVNFGLRRNFYLLLFQAFVFFITFCVLIKKGLKLVENPRFFEQVEYFMNLVLIFILLWVSLVPLISALTNFIDYYEEINADKFSVSRFNRKYLINALKKLSIRSGNCFNCSWLFNIMYLPEPTTERRIQIIKTM